jgi:hypothetical protein
VSPPDKGAGSIEYIAVLLLIAGIATAVVSSDIGGSVARACTAALCQVMGDRDCPLGNGEADSPAAANAPAALPSIPQPPPRPTKPPLPKPVCQPNPNAPWVDRLNAHNDYQNKRPLDDSLANGATSVEADVWWEDGELKLKHDQDTGNVGTLRSRYIDPLIERARQQGAIYPGRTEPFQIFVEIKSKPKREGYDQVLQEIKDLPRDVQVVLPISAIDPERTNPQGVIDAPPNVTFSIDFDDCKIPAYLDPKNSAYVHAYAVRVSVMNGDYRKCVSSNAHLNSSEKAAFTQLVQQVHDAGMKVRMWHGPDGQFREDWLASGAGVGDNPFMGDHDSNGDFTWCPPGLDDCARSNQVGWMNLQIAAGVDYMPTNHLTDGADHLKHCGEKPAPTGLITSGPPTGKQPPVTTLPSPSPNAPPRP